MSGSDVPTYEQRRFTRIKVSRPAVIRSASGKHSTGDVVDLSLCGIRLKAARELHPGTACVITFPFEHDKEIEIEVLIVYREGEAVTGEIQGIRFDSFEPLRSLLVSNTQEPWHIDTEIVSRAEILPKLY